MNYIELQKLISSDESRVLELKKTTGELKDAMHTACAFLNTDGGWLIFGVAPSSLKVIGQQVTDNTRREIAQALSLLEPAIDVQVEYIDIPDAKAGEQVIVMHFDGWVWGTEPYSYHGCAYYRIESTTKQMPRDMYDERLKAAKPNVFAWEKQIADDFTIEDLNGEHVLNAVRMGVRGGRMPAAALSLSTEEILTRFSLLEDGKPLQAAVALFAKTPKFYHQLKLRMARFRGTTNIEFIDNRQAEGNFFELLDAGMAFCFKHLNLYGKVVGLQREEHLDIPQEALREGLINALCHRSYDSISATVSLAIFDDRIEIANPGRFPLGVTPDNIKQMHASKPFNPIIAGVLYKTTWLESWGSGVQRILDACKAQGVPEPYYKLWADGTIVLVFPMPTVDGRNYGNGCGNDCGIQLTDRQRNILNIIEKDGAKVAGVIAELLGTSKRTIETELSFLHKNGFIKKATKDNRSPWVVLKKK